MRKLLITLTMIGVALVLKAQPTFMKIWDNATAGQGIRMIELPSGSIMINLAYSRGVSIMNPQGGLLQSTHYWNSNLFGPRSFRRRSANEFVFATGYQTADTCAVWSGITVFPAHAGIGVMDSTGQPSSIRYYDLGTSNCMNVPRSLELTADGGTIIWGFDRTFYALKADEAGAPVWAKSFGFRGVGGSFGHDGSFQFIRELPNGDLLAGINMNEAGAVVARMDADGNFIWCKSYIRPSGMVHDCIIESDDSIIIVGATDSIASTNTLIPLPPDYHPKLFMMKLNGMGEVQWCRGYDCAPNRWYSRRASRIVRTNDGNYAILANIGQENFNLEYRPLLMKTDINGDTLWTRSFGRNGARYATSDLLQYSDGGLIFNGAAYGNIGPMGVGSAYFIYKTDSLGVLPCHNQYHPITISELFPLDSAVTLTSTDGATMYEVTFSDTTYAPITVYDGCTFTTGIPSINERKPPMRIRPNPNTGRFTLEVPDPLMAESYYSVYDALGKLLYQRPLPAGATVEEIDLSRFGRGTYLIRLTDPEGSRHERVVLE
jgi:hypothetical protein